MAQFNVVDVVSEPARNKSDITDCRDLSAAMYIHKGLLFKLPRNGVLLALRFHKTVKKSCFLSFLGFIDPTK